MRAAPPAEVMTTATARPRDPALAVVRAWLDAFNCRDVETLVRLAHREVAVYPTKLFPHRDCYVGHDGLRRWVSEIMANDTSEFVLIREARRVRSGEILTTGEIVVHGRRVSPAAGLFLLRDGLVLSARSYLSDEQTMRDVGHIDR